ncbi:hypothetical protein Anas_13149, partial [Armadillidium nasatum]
MMELEPELKELKNLLTSQFDLKQNFINNFPFFSCSISLLSHNCLLTLVFFFYFCVHVRANRSISSIFQLLSVFHWKTYLRLSYSPDTRLSQVLHRVQYLHHSYHIWIQLNEKNNADSKVWATLYLEKRKENKKDYVQIPTSQYIAGSRGYMSKSQRRKRIPNLQETQWDSSSKDEEESNSSQPSPNSENCTECSSTHCPTPVTCQYGKIKNPRLIENIIFFNKGPGEIVEDYTVQQIRNGYYCLFCQIFQDCHLRK